MEFQTAEVRVGKYTVSIIKDDQFIGRCLRAGHEWDGWMRQDLPHIYKPGTDILDIGGNIGWNALMFSDYGPVHTFDPLFHSIIQKNVDQNATSHPIHVHRYGLSSAEAEGTMYLAKPENGLTNYGGATLDPNPKWYDGTEPPIPAHFKKLDDVYSGVPSVIKLDVERHELDVIKGAWRIITTHKPAMYIEILDATNDEIVELLKPLGYVSIPRPEDNYLFICPGNHS